MDTQEYRNPENYPDAADTQTDDSEVIEDAKSLEEWDTSKEDNDDTQLHYCHDLKRTKLHSFNYLEDIPGKFADSTYVEVQFKNTRKGYYLNSNHIPLKIGDMVVVEAPPGYDIGTVSLTGILVDVRMHQTITGRSRATAADTQVRRINHKARDFELKRFAEVRALEDDTMIRSRRIAEELGLNMKIGDVEYQGDGTKAIFYYISDERVDFRQLIKVLAETFKVRIEMRQIGARQEAGRIGGIGPCGRPLCCSLWMGNFVSVSTTAARHQDISMNQQKLQGQCTKLKCCLNFEVDAYVEAGRRMPPRDVCLETADCTYFHFKSDVFNRLITYSTDKNIAANLVTISAERVFEIIELNKAGEKPISLLSDGEKTKKERSDFGDLLAEGDVTRFDKKKKKHKGGYNENRNRRQWRENGNDGNYNKHRNRNYQNRERTRDNDTRSNNKQEKE